MHPKDADSIANSEDPGQTAPDQSVRKLMFIAAFFDKKNRSIFLTIVPKHRLLVQVRTASFFSLFFAPKQHRLLVQVRTASIVPTIYVLEQM